MTAHLRFDDRVLDAREGETVLDCLIRHQVNLANSCRAGVCQSCLVEVKEGEIPPAAQNGLKPTYKKRGLMLACQCKADHDLTVALPDDAGVSTSVKVVTKDMLNHNVLRLLLAPQSEFTCEPGQYLTLFNPHGLARSYSVANNPKLDGVIELHVRLLPGGAMSTYLEREAAPGAQLMVRGPAGSCFYVVEEGADYPIVLAGTGTGLAPLVGVAKEALRHGHRGQMRLYHGALRREDLYFVEELQGLARSFRNFDYEPCVLHGEAGHFYRPGKIEDAVLAGLPSDKSATRLFACGAPEMVNGLRRRAFLGGIASKHIFADPFVPTQAPAVAAQ